MNSDVKNVEVHNSTEQMLDAGSAGDPVKTVPSVLENKFADFTYKFVKYIPESVHPNTVTGIGIICGILGAFCFFLATFSRWFFIPAALGLVTHIVCDNFDGYMARNRNQKSARGAFFDFCSDVLVCTFAALFLGLSSYAHLEFTAFGAPLYAIYAMITLNYVAYYNEFPFPPFGPFELHSLFVILSILGGIFGPLTLFKIGNFPIMLFDVFLLPSTIGAGIFMIKYGVDLFVRLKRDGM